VLLVACQQVRNSGDVALPPPAGGSVRVASYNVHYIRLNAASGKWSVADWDRRKESLDTAFKALDADIVAFQEMESFAGGDDDSVNLARTWLLENNLDYRAAAIGDWRAFPSTQPVFYRAERFEVADQGWFFFSETPDVIYSRTFDGSYPAFASWADFRERATGKTFRLVNVHTDYSSRENREKSTALVADRVGTWIAEGQKVVFAGDLNARLGSDLHRTLERAGLSFAPVAGATYHFDRGLNLFAAIDHIGYSDGIALAAGPFVWREKPGGVWPTDHYPVIADLEIAP
jgi:endonuclease/exonuclease/phosphatase family metal-dependent hydrolase